VNDALRGEGSVREAFAQGGVRRFFTRDFFFFFSRRPVHSLLAEAQFRPREPGITSKTRPPGSCSSDGRCRTPHRRSASRSISRPHRTPCLVTPVRHRPPRAILGNDRPPALVVTLQKPGTEKKPREYTLVRSRSSASAS